MRRMLLAISLLCVGTAAWAKDVVKITYFDVPPHVIYDPATHKVSGAVVELLEYLAPEMDVELVWDDSPSNLPRQRMLLASGDRDAAALFVYNPADLGHHAFADKPYFLAKDSILVKKSSPLDRIAGVDDILKLKIGFAPETYRSGFMRDQRINWELNPAPNFNELNLKKLLAGRIDAAYAPDHAALLYEIRRAKAEGDVKIVYTPEPPVPFHVGFSKNSLRIKQKYDAAFAKLNGAKKYQELLSKYSGPQ